MTTENILDGNQNGGYLSCDRTQGKWRRLATALIAVLAASFTYGYDEPVYTVTVAQGTNSLDDATIEVTQNGETTSAAFSSLTLNQGGTFVKKGSGWLQSSTAMSVFTGEVVVAEGALILTEDGQAGKIMDGTTKYRTDWTGVASLVVSNGATIVLATLPSDTFPHLKQPVSLSGEGLNGLGAIYYCTAGKDDGETQLYYSHITLLGDTKIGYEDGGRLGIGYCVVDMNGYDLTCKTFGDSRANQVFCGLQVKNPGNIVADNTQAYFSASKTWEGAAENTVTLTNNAYFRMYNFGGQIKWTLANAHEGLIGYSSASDPSYDGSNNIWHGPVRLDKSMTLGSTSTSTDNHGIFIAGNVSGDGGFTLRHHWLRFKSKSNTFKGGVTVNTSGHLVLPGNGSLPAKGGTLKLLNGGEVLFDEAKADKIGLTTVAYPDIDWTVASGSPATLPGTTNTIVKSLVKRGAGTLNLVGDIAGTEDLTGSVAVTGVTEIAAGTLRLPCARSGFVSGWFNSGDTGDTSNSKALGNINYMTTNKIVRRTELAYTSDTAAWRKTSPAYSGVIAYHGYIWNRTEEDKRLVFAQAMWKGSYLYIDGGRIKGYPKPLATSGSEVSFSHSSGDNQRVAFYTATLSPGSHRIDLRTYTTSDWGPWGGGTESQEITNAVWKANFGWAVNWNGTDSTNCVDFSEIADPGDGSVFSVTTNGVDETLAALRTSFKHLKFTGGTLDLYGSDLHVPVFECGGGSITNSNEYQTNCTITVTDKLLVDGALYKGGTLNIHGKLKFAAGATLEGEDLSLLARGDHALVKATGGIEGLPAFDPNAEGNTGWHVGKTTVDGVETLTFNWHLGTIVNIR